MFLKILYMYYWWYHWKR